MEEKLCLVEGGEFERHVHVVCPEPGESEGTICGKWLANEDGDFKHTRKKTVTCPQCIRVLKVLRTAKFHESE